MNSLTTAQRYGLSDTQLDAFGREIDAIRQRVVADLGQEDVDYIRRMIRVQRGLEIGGRGPMFAGWFPPPWGAGSLALGVSKILDNIEIGHNVMHAQYDRPRDPLPAVKGFDLGPAC